MTTEKMDMFFNRTDISNNNSFQIIGLDTTVVDASQQNQRTPVTQVLRSALNLNDLSNKTTARANLTSNLSVVKVNVDSTAGSDTSGNGTSIAPYQTIAHALSQITDATPTKLYIIDAFGNFNETSIALKPNVFINGNNGFLTVTNQVTASAGSAVNPFFGLFNFKELILNGDMNLDLSSTTNPTVYLQNIINAKTGVAFISTITGPSGGGNIFAELFKDKYESDSNIRFNLNNFNGNINDCDFAIFFSENSSSVGLKLFLSALKSGLTKFTTADQTFEIKSYSSEIPNIELISTSSTVILIARGCETATILLNGTNAYLNIDRVTNPIAYTNGASSANVNFPYNLAGNYQDADFSGGKALQTSDVSPNFKIEESSVTNTELGYVSGVTSSIQTQLNARLPYFEDTDAAILAITPGTKTQAYATDTRQYYVWNGIAWVIWA